MEEPKGIGFYNVKSGETRYAKSTAQIQGYINSSDMGINASRGQDFNWRLDPEWVKKVKAYRRNGTRMALLAAKNGGKSPTTVQILYAAYAGEVRQAREMVDEDDKPFEEEYLQNISSKGQETPKPTKPKVVSKTEQ